MGELLVSVIFKILNFISNLFLGPVFTAIGSAIPELTTFFSSFLTFIGYGIHYTSFFVKLLMIPTVPLITLISFFVFIFGINLSLRAIGLVTAVYHYFKP